MASLAPLGSHSMGREASMATSTTSNNDAMTSAISSPPERANDALGPTGNTLSDANISSPHELTDWVDNVLDQLENRFTTMSSQVESRMKEISQRIEELESSIEELITGTSSNSFSRGDTSTGSAAGAPRVRISDA